MRISIFQNLTDTREDKDRVKDFKFSDLQKLAHIETEDKSEAPLFGLHDGASAKKKDINFLYGLVLDFDEITSDELKRQRAIANRWENYYYTTHSHKENAPKARIVIPFLVPVRLEDYEKTFLRIVEIAGFSGFDPRSVDPARRYFFPSCPPNLAGIAESTYQEGLALDPNSLSAPRANIPQAPIYDVQLLKDLSTLEDPRLAEYCTLSIAGRPLAADGNRESALFEFALALVQNFPEVEAEPFANLISASLQETARLGEGVETLEQIKRKFAQKIEDRKRYAKDKEFAEQEKAKQYEKTIEDLAKNQKVSRRNLTNRWIANMGGNFWFLTQNGYSGPFSGPCVTSAAEQELGPIAEAAGISLTFDDSKGVPKPKSPNTLVQDYGMVCEEIAYTQRGESRIEIGEKTVLVHRIHKQREDIKAVRHPEVDKWIDLFAGDQADNVRQWLAYAPRLNTVCAALAIVGKANVGKSAMAMGVSRIWSDTAPLSKEASTRFNDYRRSPLIFWDEGLAKNNRGEYDIDLFRRIVQERVHTIELKGQSLQTFQGCLRVVIAANTLPELGFSARVTPQAASAIAERLLLVEANPKASGWLSNNFHNGVPYGKLFAERDWIAEHALYLSETLPDVSDLRFKIDTRSRKLRGVALAKGASGVILRGIVEALAGPATNFSVTEDHQFLIGKDAPKFCDRISQGDAQKSDFYLSTLQDLGEITAGNFYKISVDDIRCYLEHVPRITNTEFNNKLEEIKVSVLKGK